MWHVCRLSVSGEKAQEYPGDWKVAIYLDNQLLDSRAFEIKPVLAQRKSYAVIVGISGIATQGRVGSPTCPLPAMTQWIFAIRCLL